MKPDKSQKILRYTIVGYFFLPILFFILYFKLQFQLDYSEIYYSLKNSFMQSLMATSLCLFLGTFMSFGLMALKGRVLRWVQYALLVPQVMPVFFTSLILFSILNPFPLGDLGIVSLFVFINLGLASVMLYQSQVQALGRQALTAEVYGLGRWVFLKNIWGPLMWPHLLNTGLIIFVFCFTSFSVPIIAGNGRSANFEMLIYEKIFIESNWSLATSLCLLQMLLIYVLGRLLNSIQQDTQQKIFYAGSYLKIKSLLVLTVLYCAVYGIGYLAGLVRSFSQVDFLFRYQAEIGNALFFSLKSTFYFGLVVIAILYLWLKDYLNYNQRKNPVHHFVSLSTLMVGFSIYIVFSFNPRFEVIKIVLAMSLLFFVPLYKLLLQKPIEAVRNQIEIAQMYSIPQRQIIIDVIVRQLAPQFLLWFGVITLWFMSDYAISKAVGLQSMSLGTLAAGLLTSYRLDLAYAMTLVILVVHFSFISIFYILAQGLYVAYQKLRL